MKYPGANFKPVGFRNRTIQMVIENAMAKRHDKRHVAKYLLRTKSGRGPAETAREKASLQKTSGKSAETEQVRRDALGRIEPTHLNTTRRPRRPHILRNRLRHRRLSERPTPY